MDPTELYSNFITPPDFTRDVKHSVLVIDIESDHLTGLALFCKQASCSFNVYLYESRLPNMDWFNSVRNNVDAIVINTAHNEFSNIKDMLAELPISWYYGPKSFLKNPNRIESPVDYFTDYINGLNTI
jgi:hypothetical protein